jgi:hypothetical protein
MNQRPGRQHPLRTSGIAVERDKLGRRAPRKLSIMQREERELAEQVKREDTARGFMFRPPIIR